MAEPEILGNEKQKIRYDWYQSEQRVVINVLLKNAADLQCKIIIENNRIVVESDQHLLALSLAHNIDKDKSSYRISPVKIEIILIKLVGEQWSCLEKVIEEPKPVSSTANIHQQKWDKITKEIEEKEQEEAKGEEALQALFRKIYENGNVDIQRAMNKSFSESGGTVLSTNWKEVGDKKVDVKPPDGTEYKQW